MADLQTESNSLLAVLPLRYTAMHHPFTSPKDEDMHLMEKGPDGYDPKKIGQVGKQQIASHLFAL